jgi:hypothetical protein
MKWQLLEIEQKSPDRESHEVRRLEIGAGGLRRPQPLSRAAARLGEAVQADARVYRNPGKVIDWTINVFILFVQYKKRNTYFRRLFFWVLKKTVYHECGSRGGSSSDKANVLSKRKKKVVFPIEHEVFFFETTCVSDRKSVGSRNSRDKIRSSTDSFVFSPNTVARATKLNRQRLTI